MNECHCEHAFLRVKQSVGLRAEVFKHTFINHTDCFAMLAMTAILHI
jgi:hypothetical protein